MRSNWLASLLFLVSFVTLASAFNFPNGLAVFSSRPPSLSVIAKPAQQRTTLTFADRVAYQRAIEGVYWRHLIWPKERPDPKPSLDAVMSQAQLEKKVKDYLRESEALEDYWKEPLSAEQLQAEMDRMAQHTKQPEVLRELFKALGNDPYVIAECLARPVLSERLVRNFYAHDQRFHGALKQRAEADLRAHHDVEQMKQTSGKYNEIELVRSDSEEIVGQASRLPNEEVAVGAPVLKGKDSTNGLKLNSHEWDEELQRLAAMFGGANNGRARPQLARRGGGAPGTPRQSEAATVQIKTGVLSTLEEDDARYYTTAVLNKSKDRMRLAMLEWRKEPLDFWKARAENQMPKVMAATSANYMLPAISDGASGCADDTWRATASPLSSRYSHTGVWTGSEMIIWGGYPNLNTGGRYNPSTDSWAATSASNAPSGRIFHTAVWSGSEMIVWGGSDGSNDPNTGGRYNPTTDTWTPTTSINAPAGRVGHTAVWNGTEMIVWGGEHPAPTNTGGRYNPGTDSWTATSTTNAPSGRSNHTTVWTGSEMIIWGGYNGFSSLNTGGRYNPGTNSWIATSVANAPSSRWFHTGIWTGTEMIVWGGSLFDGTNHPLNTGGRYNPSTDSWVATSTTNAPSARSGHTAAWTGSEMIVWGGNDGNGSNTGGRYSPSTDSWIATSTTNAPSGRIDHTAVWTDSEMIVWGGFDYSLGALNTGGRYNPATDTWAPTGPNVPDSRESHTAVWTGSEMIIWGGTGISGVLNTGGRYNPGTDSWTATGTSGAPTARSGHTAVWTGSEMIVWGGSGLNTGGRYNPGTDSWTATSITNAPTGRAAHTAIWTGSEMIIWGGANGNSYLNTGGRYNPVTNSWIATSVINAPSTRAYPTAVWTGSEMIVWGGLYYTGGNFVYLNTGGRYNPSTDSWIATSTTNAPSGRYSHTAVWTGGEMIVWGGWIGSPPSNTGGRYNPGTDSWTATSTTNAPSARAKHNAVWTGSEMIVWGGNSGDNTGGRYNSSMDTWIATSTANAPSGRTDHTAVWTDSEMIVWGGFDGTYLNDGGRYCAQTAPMAQSAFSRKTHGAAGTFDIPLPLSGNVGVECRSGGVSNVYQMIVNFATNVTVQSASVTSGTGNVSSFSVSGPQVTVNLTGVTNVQRITVTLFGVNDGTHMGNVPVSMGVLVGDVNGNAAVNATDVALTKSQVGQPVGMSNFREDVNASGTISATDVTIVKSDVGTSLPP